MAKELHIEDADIVVDLSGGKLAVMDFKKRIADLQSENKKLKKELGDYRAAFGNQGLLQRAEGENIKLEAENKQLRKALGRIDMHEKGCQARSVGYDIQVHRIAVQALKETQ